MPKYNPDIHRRRSIRQKEYDYATIGAYFVTICTYKRECIFGDILDGKMQSNEFGHIVEMEWLKTPIIRSNIALDGFVVMPNHFHGIMVINECRGVLQYAPTRQHEFRSPSQTIGAIIRGFKSAATKTINELRDTLGLPVWQRNFFEHIIQKEEELYRIREYINNNPLQWAEDENNPLNIKKMDSASERTYEK
ncbi:MAG: transposase [Nitrospirota bacterium]